ncbi:MAG: TolC family protein [Thermoanaerobaculia bacterium]
MKSTIYPAILLFALAASAQTVDLRDSDAIATRAVESSSAIRVLDARIEAARESLILTEAQPNPMAMGGIQNLGQDLSNDPMMTMYMIGASQTFVPKERRRALRGAAEARLEELETQRASIAAEIERDARIEWIELGSIHARLKVVEEVGSLTESMVAAARARYETARATQSDVVRAQLAHSDVTHRLISLRGERSAVVARLLSILDLPQETEVPRIEIPHAAPDATAGPSSFATHPAVESLRAAAESAEARIELARAARQPEWGIEGSWSYRPEADGMISLLARVELPIRNDSKIEPAIRQAIAEREVALRSIEALERTLAERAAIARAVRNESAEQIRFHEEVLIPQARLAFESTLSAYQTAGVDLEALIGVQSSYVRLALDFHSFLSRAMRADADLEALARGARTITVASSGMTVDASGAAPSMDAAAASGM